MENTKKQNLIRITVSLLIVLIVAGIWFVKNQSDNKNSADNILSDNPDFRLEADSLDLDRLKSYGLPIMIDFGADSCDACKEMAPILKELNSELQGKAIVKFIDVWKYPDAVSGYPIRYIPTQLFFDKNGNPFVPSDPQKMGMTIYQTNDTNEHVFTAHEGGMSKEQIMEAFLEMGMEE